MTVALALLLALTMLLPLVGSLRTSAHAAPLQEAAAGGDATGSAAAASSFGIPGAAGLDPIPRARGLSSEAADVSYSLSADGASPTITSSPADSSPKAVADWTIIVYLDGDNNLASYYQTDFSYICNAGSSSQVQVLVLFDKDSNGDTKAYHVLQNNPVEIALASIDANWSNEVNMGSASSLYSFAKFCIDNYPAEHYMVVPQDHGGAWVGCCWDDTSNSHIDIAGLKTAFSAMKARIGHNVDLVLFNDCLMSNVELLNQVSPYVDYAVGSETIGWTNNFAYVYDDIINGMKSNPSVTPRQLAVSLAQDCNLVDDSSHMTQAEAAVDLTRFDHLRNDMDNLSARMASVYDTYKSQFDSIRAACADFEGPYGSQYDRQIDLGDFIARVNSTSSDLQCRVLAGIVKDELGPKGGSDQSIILVGRWTSSVSFCYGISVYFPLTTSQWASYYTTGNDFCAQTHWDEFLQEYLGTGISPDAYEVDNTYSQAKPISSGSTQTHSIHASNDVDWVTFGLTIMSNITLATNGASGSTRMWLYNSTGVSSGSSIASSAGSPWASLAVNRLAPGTYYVKVDENGEDAKIATYTLSYSSTPALQLSDWTVMVYLDADNNLESEGIADFLEMASAPTTAGVNVIVQFDRIPGYDSSYGDWSSTKRFKVVNGMTPTAGSALSDIGEKDMGAAATLQDFIAWTVTNYPASNYLLVLWDHGGGWQSGVCFDDTSSGDSLSMAELRSAIAGAEASTLARLDVVGFDACLMGMVEVSYQLRSVADHLAFSEELVPGDGWPYDTILGDLMVDKTMDGAELSTAIVTRYMQYYGTSGDETYSAVHEADASSVADAVDAFASAMITSMPSVRGSLDAARAASEEFYYPYYIDLYDLASEVASRVPAGPVHAAADGLKTAISAAVYAEGHGSGHPGAHGLSIYFPSTAAQYDSSYGTSLNFTADHLWDEFLATYYGPDHYADDSYEPDDSYTSASVIQDGVSQQHNINDNGTDVDWAQFTLTTVSSVVVETAGTVGDTEIWVYNSTGVPSSYMAYDDDSGEGSFSRIGLANLRAGTYYIKVQEKGQDAEIGNYTLSLSVTESDDVPPSLSITSPSSGSAIGSSSVTVRWSASDAQSGLNRIEVRIDGGSWNNASLGSSWTFTGLAEGGHDADVQAFDNMGNSRTASVAFTVDVSSPSVSISSPSQGHVSATSSVTLSWDGSDLVSGIAGFEIKLDSGSWTAMALLRSIVLSGLADGPHQAWVRASDLAGNTATAAVPFKVDTIGPEVAILSPANGSAYATDSITMTWTASDDLSGVAGCEVRLDGGSWGPASSGTVQFTGLSEGWHAIELRATDGVGNVGTASVDVAVDRVRPSVTILSPAQGALLGSSTVTVDWSTDEAGSGIQHYETRLDGGAWSSRGQADSLTLIGLADGSHLFEVRAYDRAGNSNSTSVAFTTDVGLPELSILSPQAGEVSNVTQLVVRWEGSDAGSGVTDYQVRVDGASWQDMGDMESLAVSLADGVHSIEVAAYDLAGNVQTKSVSVIVDTVAPALTITSPSSGILNATTVQVGWQAVDQVSGVKLVELRVDAGGWEPLSSASGQLTLPGLAEGPHVLALWGTDNAGNVLTEEMGFIVDVTAPQMTVSGIEDGACISDTSPALSWSAQDALTYVDHFEMQVDSGAWQDLGNASTLVVGPLGDGPHRLQLAALDGAHNRQVVALEFTVDATAPVLSISSPANGAGLASTTVAVAWTAEDATSRLALLEMKLDMGEWAEVVGNGTVLTALQSGSHTIQLRATDGAGNQRMASVGFLVDVLAPSIVFLSPTDGSRSNRTSLTVEWECSDADSGLSEVGMRVDGGPWSSVAPASKLGLAGLAEGGHTIVLNATDAVGNARSSSLTFTIDLTPPAVLSHTPSDGVLDSMPSSLRITFSEAMDPDTVAVEGLPGTMAWDGNTLVLVPSPALEYGGHYVAAVVGQDLAGNHLAVHNLDFTISDLGEITGTVVDKDGAPIASATVSLRNASGEVTSTTTDQGGRFSLFARDGPYQLVVMKDGMRQSSQDVSIQPAQALKLDAVSLQPNNDWMIWLVVVAALAVALVAVAVWRGRRR